MKPETNFSFEGKSVAIIGGKGKMGQAFADGLKNVGANIHVVDRDSQSLGDSPKTDMLLFAVNERTTLEILKNLGLKEGDNIPTVTTSSTNSLLATYQKNNGTINHLIPIHPLSGPNMKGAVMINCTEAGTLGSQIAGEIAQIMGMEIKHVHFEMHDTKIALEQAKFHRRVWDSLQDTHDIIDWVESLPLSQRRAIMGELRVLIRPDISAELMAAFGGDNKREICFNTATGRREIWSPLSSFRHPHDVPNYVEDAENTRQSRLQKELTGIIEEKDPNRIIRNWIITENRRIDEGVPGGPRSFQEFLRLK